MFESLAATARHALNPTALAVLTVGSVLMVALGALLVPWFVGRMPVDFLARHRKPVREALEGRTSPWTAVRVLGRNCAGVALLVVGVALLVLPGQGLLTIILGLTLVDFPGRQRLLRRIVSSPPVFSALNKLRARMGRPPLEHDPDTDDPSDPLVT